MRTRLHHAPNPTDGNPSYNAGNDEHNYVNYRILPGSCKDTKPESHSFEDALHAEERPDMFQVAVVTLTLTMKQSIQFAGSQFPNINPESLTHPNETKCRNFASQNQVY